MAVKKWFGIAAVVTAIGAAGAVAAAKSKAAGAKAVETFDSAKSKVPGHTETSEEAAAVGDESRDDAGAAALESAEENLDG